MTNNQNRREYQKKYRERVNSDPDLLAKKREYQRTYQRRWNSKPENREKSRKASLAHYYKNREREIERSSWYNVQAQYGLSKEDFYEILKSQGGGCALCGVERQPNGKRLSIDHCHNSTSVRGILCEQCNVLLGRVEKKPGWIERVIEYLANPPAVKVINANCPSTRVNGFARMPGVSWRGGQS